MNSLTAHLAQSAPDDIALAGLFVVAVIANMPPPTKFNNNLWYAWLYDSLQAFMAARSPRPNEVHISSTQQSPGVTETQEATFPATPATSK